MATAEGVSLPWWNHLWSDRVATKPIDLKQAQARLKELMEKATRGEEVVLAEEGRVVAKIVPVPPSVARRRFGSARGLIRIHEDFETAVDDFGEYQ